MILCAMIKHRCTSITPITIIIVIITTILITIILKIVIILIIIILTLLMLVMHMLAITIKIILMMNMLHTHTHIIIKLSPIKNNTIQNKISIIGYPTTIKNILKINLHFHLLINLIKAAHLGRLVVRVVGLVGKLILMATNINLNLVTSNNLIICRNFN